MREVDRSYVAGTCAAGLCLSVGDGEARADRQGGELIDGVAAGPPVGKFLVVEALGHVGMPFSGLRPDHRAGVELAAIDPYRAAEPAPDLECGLDHGVAGEAWGAGLEIRDFPGGMRRAIPFLLVGRGRERRVQPIWDGTVLPASYSPREKWFQPGSSLPGYGLGSKEKPRRGKPGFIRGTIGFGGTSDRLLYDTAGTAVSFPYFVVAGPRSGRGNRFDQRRVIVLQVPDARTDQPADHLIGRVGGQQRLELRHAGRRALAFPQSRQRHQAAVLESDRIRLLAAVDSAARLGLGNMPNL